jgi:hypothetical protein
MRAADRLLRCGDDLGLAALGFSARHIATLRSSSEAPDGGYPVFALRAIGMHVRWLKAEVKRRREVTRLSAGVQMQLFDVAVVDDDCVELGRPRTERALMASSRRCTFSGDTTGVPDARVPSHHQATSMGAGRTR